jgi:hypothetical protein
MGVISFEDYKNKKSGTAASRPAPTPSPAPIGAGRARLLKATRNLREAALKQHAVAREFRAVTSELGDEMKKLEKSFIHLNKKMRRIRIKPLGRSANKLADTMDTFLSIQRS